MGIFNKIQLISLFAAVYALTSTNLFAGPKKGCYCCCLGPDGNVQNVALWENLDNCSARCGGSDKVVPCDPITSSCKK